MKAQHTPGPWQINGTYIYTADQDRAMIAQVYNPGEKISDYPIDANIALMAASPELFKSCKALMKYMEDGFLVRNTKDDNSSLWALKALEFVRDLNVMHTAIAKAEGNA